MAGSLNTPGDPDAPEGFSPVAEINVTPMVDVMLVLLIIFMVAAPLMTVGVPVRLPKTTTATEVERPKKPVIVSIDSEGRVFLLDEEVPADGLIPRLRELSADNPDQVVLVRGDREINYGRVMTIMGDIGAAGFHRVSLIGEARSAAPAPAPAQATPD